jgi:aminotransferase
MDQSRFIAKHVVNLLKSGIRDFFDIVAKMKDAISFAG